MPAEKRLRANGLSFDNAVTGACMCSPSRATFLTSNYPVVTGATGTGTGTLPSTESFANLATLLKQAGYTCEWKGKWHLLDHRVANGPTAFGWSATWDPPDSGTTLSVDVTLGGPLTGGTSAPSERRPSGGPAENDQLYLADAVGFLANPPSEPWCLAVDFVNPHDIHVARLTTANAEGKLIAPGNQYDSGFTTDDLSQVTAPLPASVNEDLSTKPRAQVAQAFADIKPTCSTQDYINFYAYLQISIDGALGSVLDAASDASGNLPDNLLIIRFADHGELGLSHGIVEKFYNAYDEAIRVPLVLTNPSVWSSGETTTALASLVDLVPTLAGLLGVDVAPGQQTLVGQDLTPILDAPSTGSVQDAVHFTYDDIVSRCGPSVIRAIRTADWLYAVYFDATDSSSAADWEMYDLSTDPGQTNNLAGNLAYGSRQTLLDKELVAQMDAKGPMPSVWPPTYVAGTSRGGPPPSPSQTSYSVYDLPDLGRTTSDALVYAGIRTSSRLLECVADDEDASSIADMLGVDRGELDDLVALARLMTLPGVGPGEARLLMAAGIDGIRALAKCDAAVLAARLADAVARARSDGRKIWYGSTPGEAMVMDWIAAARRATDE